MYLYKPKGRGSLFSAYPELKEIKEFADLTGQEILFVWFHSNPTSNVLGIEDPTKKIAKCIELSGIRLKEQSKEEWIQGLLPTKIKRACERMQNFQPDLRIRAKAIMNKIFDTMEEIVFIDDVKLKKMNTYKRKKHVETIMKVAENQKKLIQQMESSFGIEEEIKKDDLMTINNNGISLMEQAINNP